MPEPPHDQQLVYTVHVARRGVGSTPRVGSIIAVWGGINEALVHACAESRKDGVTYAAVTSFALGDVNSRTPVAWYRDGMRQRTPWPTEVLAPIDETAR